MKIPNTLHGFTATLLLMAGATSTPAESWQTVDDFQYQPAVSAYSTPAFASGPQGQLLADSFAYVDGIKNHWLRGSGDQGSNWGIGVDLSATGIPQGFRQIVFAASGEAFAILLSGSRWEVFTSNDGGASWTLIDSFLYASSCYAMAITVTPQGHLFVVGQGYDAASSTRHWLVRRSVDGGQSWVTVDDFPGVWASAVASSSSVVVVSGRGGELGGSTDRWTSRRSADGGTTWTTVDEYKVGPSLTSWASSAAVDTDGRFFVAGLAVQSSTAFSTRWVVRRSTDAGVTWNTVDTLIDAAGSASASGITVDAVGRLFVAGTASGGWTVRTSKNGGAPWTTSDNYTLAADKNTIPSAVVSDSFGNVFVAGDAYDANGTSHAIIRKLTGPPRLSSFAVAGQLRLSWPANATGFVLQSATTLANGGDWQASSLTPILIGDRNVVTVNPTGSFGFFRLRGP